MYRELKPKLSTSEQIAHLEFTGIKFDLISKEEAFDYLTSNSNYFKLTAYRKSFAKHPDGKFGGKYINLDFEMIKDLAIIDMRLRYSLLHMALDIEHFAKVELLKFVEVSSAEAYDIVSDYIKSLNEKQKKNLKDELERNKNNPYCGDIITKYEDNYPVWAFLEIIPFGRFIDFYRFTGKTFDNEGFINNFYLLLSIKDLRNATAHNNCLINNLSPNTSEHKTNYGVSRELSHLFSKDVYKRRMSNTRIQQIVALLYTHKKMVTSTGVTRHQCEVLNKTINRMFKNIGYYKSNDMITTNFNFLKNIIDKWFPFEYTT